MNDNSYDSVLKIPGSQHGIVGQRNLRTWYSVHVHLPVKLLSCMASVASIWIKGPEPTNALELDYLTASSSYDNDRSMVKCPYTSYST